MTNQEAKQIVKEAIQILKPIHGREWITHAFTYDDEEKCCVIGHYTRLNSDDPSNYFFKNCSDFYQKNTDFRDATALLMKDNDKLKNMYPDIYEYCEEPSIADINNHKKRNVKKRVMEALALLSEGEEAN